MHPSYWGASLKVVDRFLLGDMDGKLPLWEEEGAIQGLVNPGGRVQLKLVRGWHLYSDIFVSRRLVKGDSLLNERERRLPEDQCV